MLNTVRFKEVIESFSKEIINTHEDITGIKLTEDKWSLKEIIGHLIDSASNNHQRFVRLQFGDLLDFPAYDGEDWVKVQKCNGMSWSNLIILWYNYNILLLNIIENTDVSMYGNVWVKNEETILTLEFLINDYYRHLEKHIEHFKSRKEELLASE